MTKSDTNGNSVVCLGAAGEMGETLALHLSRSKRVRKLILADRDAEGISRVASRLRKTATCELVTTTVDILQEDDLNAAFSQCDLVTNAAGPFFRLGVPVLKRALATKTPYLDICDDPEPTLEMLALDKDAKAAGVGALIGMGASPGISNLLAKRAAQRLDEVVDCYTAWPLDVESPLEEETTAPTGDGSAISAAVVHLMEQISGMVEGVVGGNRNTVKPLEPKTLDYPGFGNGTAVTVGHPEPVTLHQSLGVKGESANLMLVKRSTAQYLQRIALEIDTGHLTLEQAAAAVLHPTIFRSARAFLSAYRSKGAGNLPPFFALVVGSRDGVQRSVGCHATTLPPGMDGVTSIPAAIAAEMLLETPLKPGVHPPESAIDAERLLDRLRPFCSAPTAHVDELAPIAEMEVPLSSLTA